MQAIRFMAVVAKISPGNEQEKWDRIARYTNQFLTDSNNCQFRNIFFDGKHCLNCYKTCFEPLSAGNTSLPHCELKEIIKITQSNEL